MVGDRELWYRNGLQVPLGRNGPLGVPCPVCEAVPYERCWNGKGTARRKAPHKERRPGSQVRTEETPPG